MWCNLENWTPRALCKKDCGNVVDGKRIEVAQRLPQKKTAEWGDDYVIHKQEDLYKIPEYLIKEIFQNVNWDFNLKLFTEK